MKKIYHFLLNRLPRKLLIRLSYWVRPITALAFRGDKVECPVCGGHFRSFLPYGVKQRPNVLCPKCLSLERHRIMWLFLQEQTDFFSRPSKVLHIAPEQCFLERFEKLKHLDYLTADIESPIAQLKMDIQQMPLPDNSFDWVFCNHVLEHVPDDGKALREIFRVLKPGGKAILQVPFDSQRQSRYEDASITDPKERELHFLQKDHLRLYGMDFPQWVKSNGFELSENFSDQQSPERRERYRLPGFEMMFAYTKPVV